MNRITVLTVAVATAFAGLAAEQASTNKMSTAEKIRYNSGGYLMPPANGKSILLIDLRGGNQETNKATWAPFLSHQKTMLDLPVTLKFAEPPKPGYDIYRTLKTLKTEAHPAVLALVDDSEAPGMSVFPEEALGLLNVNPYKVDDETLYSRRLTRELWRTFGLALGGYDCIPQGDVLRAVVEPSELDRIPTPVISGMREQGVRRMTERLRLRSNQPVPYRVACREGWAPAPTNDIQRKIWDKVHAVPDKPMKIIYDKDAKSAVVK